MRRAGAFTSFAVAFVSGFAMAAPPPIAVPAPEPSPSPSADASVAEIKREIPPEELLKMRDPFKRPPLPVAHEKAKSDLERFGTEQFKMLGVLTGPERMRAMLLAPNGRTYFVSVNTKIGTRNGYVRRITPQKIMVREKMIDVIGKEEVIDTEIPLLPEHTSQNMNESQGG